MQSEEQQTGQPNRLRPTRLIRLFQTSKHLASKYRERQEEGQNIHDVGTLPTALLKTMETPRPYDIQQNSPQPEYNSPELSMYPTFPLLPTQNFQGHTTSQPLETSARHLMELSGMMPAVRIPKQTNNDALQSISEELWPDGIRQTGVLPVVNLYGREPFGRTNHNIPAITPVPQKPQPAWKVALNSPITKVILGLVCGIGLLFLVSKFVDIPTTIKVLRTNLATPRGMTMALLSGVAFLAAFSVRGVRWKLFLNPIGKISTLKAIQLFLVGIFLNFLLPIRGGEVAKSLMLKRIAGIPVSQSLPTVAMDKALDLMPALFIMAIVPLLGVQMDIKLWLVLGAVGSLLIGLIFFVALAAWKRTAAIGLLQKITSLLPKGIGGKIEGFATGFVDSLLAGASQPKIFIPAVLLTIVAVTFDGLFAMLAFWTVGVNISFGTAIFGYTVYNMFYILPTPPGTGRQ